jgi:hypothetical protein
VKRPRLWRPADVWRKKESTMSLRTSGQLLLVGSLGLILANILVFVIPGPGGLGGPGSVPTNAVGIASGIIAIVGLPALYRVQDAKAGRAGRIGVALLALGTLAFCVIVSIVALLDVLFPGSVPHDQPHGPPTFVIILTLVTVLCYAFGGVVVGIVSLRAHALPAGIGWLLVLGGVLLIPAYMAFPNDSSAAVIVPYAVVSIMYAAWAWAAARAMAQLQPMAALRPAREY